LYDYHTVQHNCAIVAFQILEHRNLHQIKNQTQMTKLLPLALFSISLLFFSCQKEEIPQVEPTPELSIDRQEDAAQITRTQNFLTQALASLSMSSTVATYNNSILACPNAEYDAVDANLLHLNFGDIANPCNIGTGTMIGGTVDLHQGNTGNLLNTCPGPYTKGSLIFDNLYVAGCYVNVQNQNDWDNLYFYAKDHCDAAPSQSGEYVDFNFVASPTWSLQFTDGNRISTIDPIISTSGPFIVANTIVPNDDLFDYSVIAGLQYKLHIPFVENYGTGNYYTTLTTQNSQTLIQESKWGIYTAINDALCFSPLGSQYITQGTLYAFDLEAYDSDLSVTTYDFGYDGNGNDAGGDDAFVRVCYNEKIGEEPNQTIVEVCKELECLIF